MSQSPRTESFAPGGKKPPGRIELIAGGTELAHRFEVRDVLGTGGYAVVYRAFDHTLQREVALKVLRQDRLSPGALRRLRREAAVARDVVHPRIVRIFDIEEAGETVFLTMEIVDGGALGDRLTLGPVPIAQAIAWATQALEGLAALHALGILHRDVKPGNLLLTASDEIKVSDFGLALHLERDETRATAHEAVLGTLEYLSPEQALGQPVDARSDLYSLGVVLFEMIAGRLPFVTQSSLGSLLERLRQEETPDLAELRPETPPWLAAVVRRLLEREPARRYPSALAVLGDLQKRSARNRGHRQQRIRRWTGFAAGALALFGASWGAREWSRTRFSHIVADGDRAFQALDVAGRTLWRHEAAVQAGNFVRFNTAQRGDLIAANLAAIDQAVGATDSYLDLLDPQSGRSVERLLLPSGHLFFDGFSDTYSTSIQTVDLDDDGADEILVSFAHAPYYPSYNVLVDPGLRDAQLVFASAGHHRLVGTVDLDGDGRRELLLGGINNRVGWSSGLAAIRVPAQSVSRSSAPLGESLALAPDLDLGNLGNAGLLWYELLAPPIRFAREQRIPLDPLRRTLVLGTEFTTPVEIGFDGFLAGTGQGKLSAARETSRRAAYERLRESTRLESSGHPNEAVEVLRTAIAAATAADDPALLDWTLRRQAHVLLATGDRSTALTMYESLWSSSAATASEIAYECARGLHAAGALAPALDWYRRALGKGAASNYGRNKFEVVQGIAFTLAEQRRFAEATSELDRFDAAYPQQQVRPERAFLAWRAGEAPPLSSIPFALRYQDLHLYWRFELRLLNGEDPGLLLDELPAAIATISSFEPLFTGFEGELLARLGRNDEAATRLESALRQARFLSRDEPNYRVHLPILEERLRRVEKAAKSTSPRL